ncbi:MAG TPA: hypothetical protein VF112_02990 [Candidatus Dormibacteraeota bacterium]
MSRADALDGLDGGRGVSPSQRLAIEAIGAATAAALDMGHRLGGFSRRSTRNGYRFVAHCRGCGHELSIRADGAHGHALPLPTCPQTGAHRSPASLAAEDHLLGEIAALVDTARRATVVADRVAALTQIERLSGWALQQCQMNHGSGRR